jgi:SAM-dependent methyltransferase
MAAPTVTPADVLPPCHACGADALVLVEGFSSLRQVTSDCQPWRKGGLVAACRSCGLVQKPDTPAWRQEADEIYAGYRIYYQSGGEEQRVFDPLSGAAASRSSRLVAAFKSATPLKPTGRLLDFGCGNGALLRAFADAMPRWRLTGSEINESYRAAVESIPGVEAFHTGPLREVPGRFDVITMVHCVEHISAPVSALADMRKLLTDDGVLLIEVPDFTTNPFDLLIADHASHFSPATLRQVIEAADYGVDIVTTDWVTKEISAVGRPTAGGTKTRASLPPTADGTVPSLQRSVQWLARMLESAEQSPPGAQVGVFGTSIAATWLAQHLADRFAFFVDEDPARIGRSHFGRPIIAPADIPDGSHVVLPLAPVIAKAVDQRLRRPDFRFVLPPELA